MTDWLTRYRNGQRDQVWHELGLLGGEVRESGRIDEARAVCGEMAHRARQNVEAIVQRLTEDGFRFRDNNDAQTPAVQCPTRHPPTTRPRTSRGWNTTPFVSYLSWVFQNGGPDGDGQRLKDRLAQDLLPLQVVSIPRTNNPGVSAAGLSHRVA